MCAKLFLYRNQPPYELILGLNESISLLLKTNEIILQRSLKSVFNRQHNVSKKHFIYIYIYIYIVYWENVHVRRISGFLLNLTNLLWCSLFMILAVPHNKLLPSYWGLPTDCSVMKYWSFSILNTNYFILHSFKFLCMYNHNFFASISRILFCSRYVWIGWKFNIYTFSGSDLRMNQEHWVGTNSK